MDLDFTTKLPFARDRVIECSFWALGTFAEPQYVFARQVLSKTIAMLSVMDDIYDVHGTIEELELFTKVVDRFDRSLINFSGNIFFFADLALAQESIGFIIVFSGGILA